MTVKTKQITFVQLMKEFTKYVATSKTRPVLQCVSFDGETFTATNSHVMLKVNKEAVSDIPKEVFAGCLYNPKIMQFVTLESKYPETKRLLPNINNIQTEINLDGHLNNLIKEMKELCKTDRIISAMTPSNQITILDTGNKYDSKLSLSIKGEIDNNKINIEKIVSGKPVLLHLNAKYLINALGTCKKLSKLNDNKCTLNIIGRFTPMNFRQENVFDLIVLPVRVY